MEGQALREPQKSQTSARICRLESVEWGHSQHDPRGSDEVRDGGRGSKQAHQVIAVCPSDTRNSDVEPLWELCGWSHPESPCCLPNHKANSALPVGLVPQCSTPKESKSEKVIRGNESESEEEEDLD